MITAELYSLLLGNQSCDLC